jgi:chromosomal replication initiator protein
MTQELGTVWSTLSTLISARVSADGYQRWFSDIEVSGDDGAVLTLSVPNPIQKFFIESNYLPLLQEAAADAFDTTREIRIVARQNDDIEDAPVLQQQRLEDPVPARPAARERASSATVSTGMNPRNTFDSFVVGSNNQFAYAAALAVAQAPAKTYNPLFIYGGSGLGKTHLLQAVGHHVLASRKNAKVFYLSSEQFTNEFIDAIQHGTLVKFRKNTGRRTC